MSHTIVSAERCKGSQYEPDRTDKRYVHQKYRSTDFEITKLTEQPSSNISRAKLGSSMLANRSGNGTSTSFVKDTPKGNICVLRHLMDG